MAVSLTEEQVLCSYLVQHPNLANMYADSFDKGIFLEQLHSDIYTEIKRCFAEQVEVNRYTLCRKFGDEMISPYTRYTISEKTALSKIDSLLRSQVEHYTDHMLSKRCNQYITLHQQGEKINNDAFVNELVNLLDVGTESTAFTTSDAVEYLMQQIQSPQKRDKGISSGYACLDKMLNGGFRKKHLNVIIGASGMGKTSFVENLQLQMALHARGAFFSLEMPKEEIADDWFGILTGTRINKVIDDNAYVSPDGVDNMIVHMSRVKDKLDVFDNAEWTVGAIQRVVRMYRMQKKPLDFIIIDHFHILKRPQRQQESEALAELARLLKVLAKEEDVAVIVLAQLNRDAKDRKIKNPLLTDVKGSSGLAENSDVVMGLYRPSYDLKQHTTPPPALANVIEVTFPKGRRLDAEKLYMELDWTGGKLVGQLSETQEMDYLSALSNLNKESIGGKGGVDFRK